MLKLDQMTKLLVTAANFLQWHIITNCTNSKNGINFVNYKGTYNNNNINFSAKATKNDTALRLFINGKAVFLDLINEWAINDYNINISLNCTNFVNNDFEFLVINPNKDEMQSKYYTVLVTPGYMLLQI